MPKRTLEQQNEDDCNAEFCENESDESEESPSHQSKRKKVSFCSKKAPEDGVALTLGDWNFGNEDIWASKKEEKETEKKNENGTHKNDEIQKKEEVTDLNTLHWSVEEQEAIAWTLDSNESKTNPVKDIFDGFAFDTSDLQWGTETPVTKDVVPIVELNGTPPPTGEEADTTHFRCNVKIYVFDTDQNLPNSPKVWKQHGSGELLVNNIKEKSIGRLVCRQQETGVLRLNCPITNSFSCKVIKNDRVQFTAPLTNDTTTTQDTTSSSSSSQQKRNKDKNQDNNVSVKLILYSIRPIEPSDVLKIVDAINKIQEENKTKSTSTTCVTK